MLQETYDRIMALGEEGGALQKLGLTVEQLPSDDVAFAVRGILPSTAAA